MDLAKLPVLSLSDAPADFARAIGASFREYGFALVKDHGIDSALIDQAWDLTAQFFALSEEEKRKYFIPGIYGARGYTPFKTEIAKGAKAHDLKEFWHVGRDLPEGSPLASSMPPNVWPDSPAGFQDVFTRLYAEFDKVGATILSRIALHLGLDEGWFDPAIEDGNSVMRLLHYPPVTDAEGGAIRAGAHEDINLITLLLGAQEAGLELLTKDGRWVGVAPPEGTIVINIGDMLQRLTNHVLPSTTHRVRNPDAERAAHSRYSMPFFLHLRSDFPFKTLEQCITEENPDRYPVSITADDYLQERLREIGLKK
ncbi:isopenicillin N synthase family dioxygenase [Novosphingobium sp. KACC 22771]|uniref:isopenicillin N synthase family dioxygenase n=1 Tax=Novosphingobium sp. KACC 22771 TaxID=3025670 RepID=UPI00236628AA|nr:2-oxoglutarate and iron-dependent oxygenase domain-containing protein [Novosphingobium sp. KACC 22771]WDF73592.1 2-oxoglutarate and iron-dependent oxygenase domain-containing protein [Novosphingobium sp. KACC 22771]